MSQKKNNSTSLERKLDDIMQTCDAVFSLVNVNSQTHCSVKGKGLQLCHMISTEITSDKAEYRDTVAAILVGAVMMCCERSNEFFTKFDATYEDFLKYRRNGKKTS